MPDPAEDVQAHVTELATRCDAMMDGVEVFLPLAAAVEREITRVEEALGPMKRRETDAQVLGFTDGMEQRQRAFQTVVRDLKRQVERTYDIVRELKHMQRPFLEAVKVRGTDKKVAEPTFPIVNG